MSVRCLGTCCVARTAMAAIAAKLPASTQTTREASSVIRGGIDIVGEVPAARWSLATQPTAESAAQPLVSEPIAARVRHGGFMSSAQLVDNGAFRISPAETAAMDPAQRLFLELGYEALHGACLDRASLQGSLTGER